MAAEFSQESVLRFLISSGGRARNTDLLTHYRRFLREHADREQNRELFKRFVNCVATVRQEDGASHVVLRKKYRVHLERDPKPALPDPHPETPAEVLPAAGIIFNTSNNNNRHCAARVETAVSSPAHAAHSCSHDTCPAAAAPPDSRQQPRREHSAVYPAKHRQLREADGCQQSVADSTHCAYYEVGTSPPPETTNLNVNTLGINTYKQLKKQPEEPVAKERYLHASLGQCVISTSTPCLLDVPVAPLYTPAGLSRSSESLLKTHGAVKGFPADVPNPPVPLNAPPAYLQLHHPTVLASSYDSLSTPSSLVSDTGWLQDCGRDQWPSDDSLKCQELAGHDGNDARVFLRRSQETRLLSQLRQSSGSVTPLYRSTGHLHVKDSRSSPRSASPEAHYGPVARRLSSRLQSRMCRSLGENLDQPFPEETISSRHNRLQLLSSTLSMGNLVSASSSRGLSSRDSLSSPAGSTRSLGTSAHDGSFSSKYSSVPLDPREHEWFVKAASGSWTDIYALFREDPNLLTKRDFISGFTVLHWIAKHGDHRVLNTLWYGVEKAGMTLDVDTKTLCGYTPLHLAAIHGHKKLIRLLVQKFQADVRIRDSSGKRPWQYLCKDENRDILDLLGAPPKAMQSLTDKLPTTKINVKRHSSIAALFKHKPHLRVSSSSEPF